MKLLYESGSVAEEIANEARAEGKAEGKSEGRAEGKSEGRAEAMAELASRLIREGMPDEKISILTELPVNRVAELISGR